MKTGVYIHFKGGTVLVYDIAETVSGEKTVSYYGLQDHCRHTRLLSSFNEKVKKEKRFCLDKDFMFTIDDFINGLRKNNKLKDFLIYDMLDNSEGRATVSYVDLRTAKHYNIEKNEFIEMLLKRGTDPSLIKFKEGESSMLNSFLKSVIKENYEEFNK